MGWLAAIPEHREVHFFGEPIDYAMMGASSLPDFGDIGDVSIFMNRQETMNRELSMAKQIWLFPSEEDDSESFYNSFLQSSGHE